MRRYRALGSAASSYRVRLCVDRERHYVTIKTTDRRAAEHSALAQQAELKRGRAGRAAGVPGAIPFSALLELFEAQELPTLARRTQEAYRDSLKLIRSSFVEQLQDPAVDRIHAKHVTAYFT